MKNLICLLLCTSLFISNAQMNQEITTPDGQQFLLGKITLDGLQAGPYSSWYESGYENYVVDQTLIQMFKKQLNTYEVKLFLGTWCGDSKRQVPRLAKILKAAAFPMEKLEVVALDRRRDTYKTSPGGEEKGLNIVKVPTIIFLKNGKEINRIIERPIESLEEDISAIVNQKGYTPNYAHLKRAR